VARRREDERPVRTPPGLSAVASPDVDAARGADLLGVPVAGTAGDGEADAGPRPGPGAAEAAARYGIDLASVLGSARFTGAAGSALAVPTAAPAGPDSARPASAGPSSAHDASAETATRTAQGRTPGGPTAGDGEDLPPRLVLVGTGDGSTAALRRAGAALARAAAGVGVVATTAVAGAAASDVRAFAEGFLLGAWTPERSGVRPGPPPPAGTLRLLGVRAPAALSAAATAAGATWLVRDLATTPSTVKTPAWVAARAVAVAATSTDLQAQVLDLAELTEGGFGGLLAVGRGSVTEPRLVTVTYTPPSPGRRRPRHVVLVGKGITFDTGGLSVKPSDAMVPMKTDMAGAAVVLATVLGAAQSAVRHRVTAVLALAENAFGGASYRPGDVVTIWGGTTVEVFNTDAEGRMVLADALAWADATLEPDVLLDVATLTGAASLGLGRGHAALYTADDALAAGLEAAASATGERVWRMPLVEEYRRTLESEVADLRHIPDDRRVGGGSITAALFLREFAGRRRWAHLDIAGPARAAKSEHEVPKGATGYGARLLLDWLQNLR
jgi:leucyl aminopeptidase